MTGWQRQRRCPSIRRMAGAALILALTAWLFRPGMPPDEPLPPQLPVAASAFILPDNVVAGLPAGPVERLTITRERLAQGKLLLVDEAHPLPADFSPGNTYGILAYARGRIACRDPQAVLGEEALIHLEYLCVDARNSGMDRLTVFAGTRSREQQRILLTDAVASFARDMSIDEAVVRAKETVDAPGHSEHQLPWTVDIRLCRTWNDLPAREPLEASPQGAWLKEHAWEHGFIQRWPEADTAADDHRPYHFRYVGIPHARMMRALGLDLDAYLALLRQAGALTLLDEEGAPLATAVCVEAGERHTVFEVPAGARLEDASLDNTGWAAAILTYR